MVKEGLTKNLIALVLGGALMLITVVLLVSYFVLRGFIDPVDTLTLQVFDISITRSGRTN